MFDMKFSLKLRPNKVGDYVRAILSLGDYVRLPFILKVKWVGHVAIMMCEVYLGLNVTYNI